VPGDSLSGAAESLYDSGHIDSFHHLRNLLVTGG
jgi:hypothetical protein